MTALLDRATAATRLRGRFQIPDRAAFYLLASTVVALLASSSAPTPLYALYQAEWGFSPITTTVVFGIYALAILVALLTVGSLSDHIGRRPVLIAALLAQAGVMVVFTTAAGVPELTLARILQGLATGAAVGAIGAGLLDLDRVKGTVANSVAPMLGTGSGGLLAGILVQFLPAPTHLVYLVLGGVFIAQAAAVGLMRETSSPRPGALASLRIQVALPPAVRRPVLVATPVLIAVWALAGFYGSLGPALVRLISGSDSYVLAGLPLSVIAGSGAVAVLVMRHAAARTLTIVGTAALLIGVGLTLIAVEQRSTGTFFLGSALAGVGFGAGFQGAIRTVVPLARPHERAGVLSIVYLVSYLAMGVPAVIAGFLVVDSGGLLTTTREYAIAVMLLAAVALAESARPRRAQAQVVELSCPNARQESLAEAG
jgi:MFS family permease